MKSFQFMKNHTQRQQLAQPESKSAKERQRERGGEGMGVAGRTAQPIKLMDVYL